MRFFLKLAYQGTNYSGWQKQTNTPKTIQQVLEDTTSKMLGYKVFIKGCGRTDQGVHASEYYAHIDLNALPNYNFIDRVNHMLPDDISILEMTEVREEIDSQFDANWRTYEYYFHLKKTPKIHHTSAYYKIDKFDKDLFNKGMEIIRNTKDFRSLCKHPDFYKHTLCTIKDVSFENIDNDHKYLFTITANRFLRGMIRYMIARLIDVAQGKLTVDQFEKQIASKESFQFPFHKQGHPQGLYLSKIEYPDTIFKE